MNQELVSQNKGLASELDLKIKECEMLHKMLENRPIEVVDIEFSHLDYENHVQKRDNIRQLLSDSKRFHIKTAFNGEAFWIMPIKYLGDEIFCGIVDNKLITDELKLNDMVEFSAWDVIEIEEVE